MIGDEKEIVKEAMLGKIFGLHIFQAQFFGLTNKGYLTISCKMVEKGERQGLELQTLRY